MATQKKGPGRPRKEPAPVQQDNGVDSANLAAKVKMLEDALLARSAEAEALRVAARQGGVEHVVVRNTGLAQVVIPIDEKTSLVLDGRGSRMTGSIPVDVYTRLKRDTSLFERGYLVCDSDPTPTPNYIPDIAAWLDNTDDSDLEKAVQQITTEMVLRNLWEYAEHLRPPTSKSLLLMRYVGARVEELFGYTLVASPTLE